MTVGGMSIAIQQIPCFTGSSSLSEFPLPKFQNTRRQPCYYAEHRVARRPQKTLSLSGAGCKPARRSPSNGSTRTAATAEQVAADPHHGAREDKEGGKDEGAAVQGSAVFAELMDWLTEEGLPPCKITLKERPGYSPTAKPIHYVAAKEDLKAGEVVYRIPSNLVVTLERVLGDESIAELLTTNKLSELACLALYLMYEKKQGRTSFWYPFIHELDRQRGRGQMAIESPLLWSEKEVEEYFKGSPMKDTIAERLKGIEREYEELDTVWFMAGSLFKQYPFDIPTEAFPFQIFKQAFVAIQACVVHLQGVSLARRFALVPLGPPLLAYKSNCRAMLAAEDGFIKLALDRDVKAGEPISVWCGPQPNARLLLNYGFVDEDNPYDRLSVQAALDANDPLYQSKRAIVQKNSLLTKNVFQVFKGREKDAVVEMMPYLRLGNVTDPLEMESVSFAQGPVCGVSPCIEIAVLVQLEEYFQGRLDAYQTSIHEDDAVIADSSSPPKKVVATKLLRIEKQILLNTLAAIRELKADLPASMDSAGPCNGSYRPVLS
eukprot:TRINITY_DN8071_c1_g1_i1.p1 TRINITY_DN8071_c1_g1~~TRINITY_DN8071_c1_g1_i1.p1  ORF type:complete len:547 (-),score=89.83 TRINITY_DN8071_c1_g1_i1:824-2464(-)